jgi:hypothetical protein
MVVPLSEESALYLLVDPMEGTEVGEALLFLLLRITERHFAIFAVVQFGKQNQVTKEVPINVLVGAQKTSRFPFQSVPEYLMLLPVRYWWTSPKTDNNGLLVQEEEEVLEMYISKHQQIAHQGKLPLVSPLKKNGYA